MMLLFQSITLHSTTGACGLEQAAAGGMLAKEMRR